MRGYGMYQYLQAIFVMQMDLWDQTWLGLCVRCLDLNMEELCLTLDLLTQISELTNWFTSLIASIAMGTKLQFLTVNLDLGN